MNAVNKSKYFEDWYADTGTALHMADSLACVQDLKPCQTNVNGIGGVSSEVEFSGTLGLVFVTADSEFSVRTCCTPPIWDTTSFLRAQSLMASHGMVLVVLMVL